MKIVSWNVNGLRSINGQNPKRKYGKVFRKNKLFEYLDKEQPDIMCIQETKSAPEQIKEELLHPPGYTGYSSWSRLKKGYSGVVTYTKEKPKTVVTNVGVDEYDVEGRLIQTDFDDFSVFNIYFPNGTSGQHRVDYKLRFYDDVFRFIEEHRMKQPNILVTGDYNTAHHPIDLARPKDNEDTSGFLPEEREKMDEVEQMGYVDTFRQFTKDGGHYTWWSNRGRARDNNVGWRIDYHRVTEDLNSKVKNSYHQPDVTGSDHCPIVIELDI